MMLAVAAFLWAGAFYFAGTFDRSLYQLGLNWESCAAQSSGNQPLCGDQLAAGISASNGVREELESLF